METVFVGGTPRLAVSVAGEGELLLFLHGIRGHRGNWNRQVEAFSRHYQAAACDARGYGDSDDNDGPRQFDHFTVDVLRVVEHFKQERIHLVGLSMGGRIARNFALRYPERLHTLTLVSTTPGFHAFTPEEVKRFVTERKTATPETTRRLFGSRARKGAFEELMDGFTRIREPSYLKTLEASVAQDRNAPIEKISVPTLVIAGDEDQVYPPALAQDLARRIPGARLEMMRGLGHLPNMEQPEEFNAVLLRFLKEQEKRS